MVNIFDKLMLAKQLNFTEGKIEMLGQNVVITPSDFFALYVMKINDKPELIAELYEAAKKAVKEGFGVNIGKAYGFSFKDYSNWFVELTALSGWGKISWEENDPQFHKGVIAIEGSPTARYLQGKVKEPCDHIIRGLMAGGASSAYRLDTDIIEIECQATGAQKCRFIIDSIDNLRSKFSELTKKQLGK